MYREFETQHLAQLVAKQQNKEDDGENTPDIEDCDGAESGDDDANMANNADNANVFISKQTELIRKIWRQQIAIPHFQIEATYRNYQDWECALYGKASIEAKPKYNASKKLSKYFKEWEHQRLKLSPNISPGYANMDRLQFWKQYVRDIMQKIKNIKPKTVQSLFERAILDCFLHEGVWKDYIEWIIEKGLKFEIIHVCARSIRNIPSSVTLWIEYVNACQWNEIGIDEVNKRIFARFIFPNQLGNKLQKEYKMKKEEIVTFGSDIDKYILLGIAKCEFYRRRAQCVVSEKYDDDAKCGDNALVHEAESVFDQMAEFMDAHIASSVWVLTFYKFFIDFLSRFVGKIEKARGLWEKLVKQRGKEWNVWIAFIEWEQSFGEQSPVKPSSKKLRSATVSNVNLPFGQRNIYQIRHLYHRAIFILDIDTGLQYVGEKLLEFERCCGDLESFNNAQIRYQKKLKLEEAKRKKNEAKRMKLNKRKRNDFGSDIAKEPVHKRTKHFDRLELKSQRQQKDPNYVGVHEKGTKQERTVFVVNFRKTMTKKAVTELFAEYGKIESVKLPKNEKAKHQSKLKGFGYIEYKHKDFAAKCIKKLNGKEVQGKILRIERYRERDMHSNTVYVRGLSKMNEFEANECIKSMLSECGEIREIRLTREQHGNGQKLKGFGYVEFVNESSVQKALKCDKREWKNKIIEIREYKSAKERVSEKEGKSKKRSLNEMYVDDDDSNSEKVNEVSTDFGNKMGFKPRSIGKRKTKIKENHSNRDAGAAGQVLDKQMLNKPNKSADDFRKLFGI